MFHLLTKRTDFKNQVDDPIHSNLFCNEGIIVLRSSLDDPQGTAEGRMGFWVEYVGQDFKY